MSQFDGFILNLKVVVSLRMFSQLLQLWLVRAKG